MVSLIALFVFYLSLTIAGQTFLSFQWDILLLETGFLAIFLAPWQTLAEARTRTTGLARRAVFAQAAAFQIDADVWRGEADQR